MASNGEKYLRNKVIPPGKDGRKLISFEEDIFADAAERLGGEFTMLQIRDVWYSFLSYLRGLLAHTDIMRVSIPNIGVVEFNAFLAGGRLKRLYGLKKRKGRLRPHEVDERDRLEEKIRTVKEARKKYGKRSPLIVKNSYNTYMAKEGLKHGLTWEELQDFQNKRFYEY